jgi:hypothetical protein
MDKLLAPMQVRCVNSQCAYFGQEVLREVALPNTDCESQTRVSILYELYRLGSEYRLCMCRW